MSKQQGKTANWDYILLLLGVGINTILFLSVLAPAIFVSALPVQVVDHSEPFGLDIVGLLALFTAGMYCLSGLKIIASEIAAMFVCGLGFPMFLVALIWMMNTSSTGHILSSTSILQFYCIFIFFISSIGLITVTWYTKAIIRSHGYTTLYQDGFE